MAGAEARALWQRAINRCIVQEDAKRAPKLACCQATTSAKQADGRPCSSDETSDCSSSDVRPINRNPVPNDSSWWLQMQHTYGCQKPLTTEQTMVLEGEKENLKMAVKTLPSKNFHNGIADVNKCERNVPWWRATNVDDLAALVAQKSVQLLENCDLPPPQKSHIRKYICSSDKNDEQTSLSLQWQKEQLTRDNGRLDVVFESLSRRGNATITNNSMPNLSDAREDSATQETCQAFECDLCKAQLLEALRHSQTRAREAEQMAEQAFAEKDDIVKLFLRQASQLFAYKQWFKLFQLESFFDQLTNSDQPIHTLFPIALPGIPRQDRDARKSWHKSSESKRGTRKKHDLGRYAFAFAVGLSLVGAGLLLGWTVAWMFPF